MTETRTFSDLWLEYMNRQVPYPHDYERLKTAIRDTLRADILNFKAGRASKGRVRGTRADAIRLGKLRAAERD